MKPKSKAATVILSFIPGVGHLYLGWQERGLQFLLGFFLTIFLIPYVSGMLAVLLPVIWFYSLFDALQCYEFGRPDPASHSPYRWILEKQRWVGFGLIVLGTLILFNRVIMPELVRYLDYRIMRMIGPALLALLFIAGGIRLALGKQIPAPALQKKGEDE
jgi:hypothetical protein